MNKYKRGLIIGRFQPFHNGHLHLVRQTLEECEELIIVIGSAQFNFLYKDPFTAGERIEMIHDSLISKEINNCNFFLIPLVNFENNACWLEYLKSMVPKFEIIYSGNEYVCYLSKKDIIVKEPIFVNKIKYNGENIRKLIVDNKKWDNLVPLPVKKLIMKFDGIERIKLLSRSDTIPQKW
jgi:nicotinamide-nucleotide adenylyltransferase